MKKLMFVIVLLFTVFICAAPELDSKLKEYNRDVYLDVYAKVLELRAYDAEINRFANALQLRESPDWTKINQIGCMGYYQFTAGTLLRLGYGSITPERFREDPQIFPPELQKKVLIALINSNKAILSRYERYIGTTINGTVITRSGLIAAAHLGGAGSVVNYLTTYNQHIHVFGMTIDVQVNAKDANGTSIADYIREFKGYNI